MELTANSRVAILLHGGIKGSHGKTGLAFLRYSQTEIVAIIDREAEGESLARLTGIQRNLPIVRDVASALIERPDILLIGIAPSGGQLPADLLVEIETAVRSGLSIINGLHTPLKSKFTQSDSEIWDIRQEPQNLHVGKGAARSLDNTRILMVGTGYGNR